MSNNRNNIIDSPLITENPEAILPQHPKLLIHKLEHEKTHDQTLQIACFSTNHIEQPISIENLKS